VGAGHRDREGTRMGLWGASQAIAFGVGGFLGTLLSDGARHVLFSPSLSYAVVFAAEAALFLYAACLAVRIEAPANHNQADRSLPLPVNQSA
jgi:MFS transporter, BCD family, chlorophyll transporter